MVLQTIHLTKRFGNFLAVDSLNIQVEKGDIFGFLGPNGAGKSTTIRMITSLIKPCSGEVIIFDLPLTCNRRFILSRVGALIEKPGFYSYLSARKNLEIFASLIPKSQTVNINHVLEIVGLTKRAEDKVKTYSQGMKQRLGIAQTLLGNPELIILDEPTNGLDPQGMKEIRELILRLSNQGFTIFLSSHLLHEIEQICTNMAIINNGKLIIQGTVNDLLNMGTVHLILKVRPLQKAISILENVNALSILETHGSELVIDVQKHLIPEITRKLVAADIDVFAIEARRSLEDFFLSIIKDENDPIN